MSANERLHNLQSALTARGVKDVKFCFGLGVFASPPSEVLTHVADFMEKYASGQYEVLPAIGDAHAIGHAHV